VPKSSDSESMKIYFEEPRRGYIVKRLEVSLLAAMALPYTLWAEWFLTSQVQGLAAMLVFVAFAFAEVVLVTGVVWVCVLRKRFVVMSSQITLPHIQYVSKGKPRLRQVIRLEEVVSGEVRVNSVEVRPSWPLVEWEAELRLRDGGTIRIAPFGEGTAKKACAFAIQRFLEAIPKTHDRTG